MKDTSRLPLVPAITGLAIPAALSFLLQNLYHQNDAWFIGKLGPEASAGMMPVVMVQVANFGFILTLARGTQSLVGRSLGAGRMAGVEGAIGQGLRLSLLALVPLAVLEWIFAEQILGLMGGEGEALAHGVRYLRTLLLFMPCLFAMPVLDFALQGLGDTRTPFRLQMVAVLANTALNWALVLPHALVWGPDGCLLDGVSLPLPLPGSGQLSGPGLGVAGAAIATGLSRGLAAALALAVLVRGKGLGRLLQSEVYGRDPRAAREVLRVGVPAGSSTFLFALVGMVVTSLVGRFGQAALGGYYIGFRAIESVSFMVVLGFGMATGTVAAHAVGAGDFARARKAGHVGALLCSLPMLVTTALFLAIPEALAAPFSDDPQTVAAAASYLAVMAFCQLPQGLEMVYADAMAGAGSSLLTSLVSIPGNLARLPLALAAAAWGLGLDGIWYAILATAVFKGVAMTALFASRRWEKAMLAGRAAFEEGNR